ncbi:MAG: response regulator transcription factor [Bacilli bacterium]|nr:response regulator transcription factor [Bacilli bacterium]
MRDKEKKILIIDDEKSIVETIKAYLIKEEFEVFTAFSGREALQVFNNNELDLIVLDLMLPEISGEDVCKIIRQDSNIPIIMLSAKINEDSKLNGFSLGADDYITKPFSPKELVARIHSIFKRLDNQILDALSFNSNDLKINFDSVTVEKNNQTINLTPTEFKILSTLAKNPKRTYARDDLLTILSSDSYELFERTIDSHIKNIRGKIEDDKNKYIITVRGFGYKFNG